MVWLFSDDERSPEAKKHAYDERDEDTFDGILDETEGLPGVDCASNINGECEERRGSVCVPMA